MKLIKALLLVGCLLALAGCNDEAFDAIDEQQSFLASMNILEPTITFYDEGYELLAIWHLEKGLS